VDLVEDRQGEDLSDPWDAPQELEGVRVVVPSLADYREFERADDQLEVVDEREIGGYAVSDADVLEVLSQPIAIGAVRDALARTLQVVLVMGHLDVSEER
jgi:hypothetical protein